MSDDVQRRGSEDLESTAREAGELAEEAHDVAESRRRAAGRGPSAPDGRGDDPPEELRANQVRVEDDARTAERQQVAAEQLREAAETLQRNRETVETSREDLREARERLRGTAEATQSLVKDAERLREMARIARERADEVPGPQAGGGSKPEDGDAEKVDSAP
jgi:chromosome segregation ATPase